MTTQIRSAALANFKAGTIENTIGVNEKSLRQVGDIAIPTTSLAINDTIILGEVTHRSLVDSILIANDVALDSNMSPLLTIDIGLYTYDFRTDVFTAALNASAASLAACFASASTVLQGASNTLGTELSGSAGNINVAGKFATRVADLIGNEGTSGADVALFIGIKIHAAAATAVAGNISYKIAISC